MSRLGCTAAIEDASSGLQWLRSRRFMMTDHAHPLDDAFIERMDRPAILALLDEIASLSQTDENDPVQRVREKALAMSVVKLLIRLSDLDQEGSLNRLIRLPEVNDVVLPSTDEG